jgi:hypothetical protein
VKQHEWKFFEWTKLYAHLDFWYVEAFRETIRMSNSNFGLKHPFEHFGRVRTKKCTKCVVHDQSRQNKALRPPGFLICCIWWRGLSNEPKFIWFETPFRKSTLLAYVCRACTAIFALQWLETISQYPTTLQPEYSCKLYMWSISASLTEL